MMNKYRICGNSPAYTDRMSRETNDSKVFTSVENRN